VELAKFAETDIMVSPEDPGVVVPARLWTSTLKRTRQTARHIKQPAIMVEGYPWVQMKPRVWSNLDEIYAGACDGMTCEEEPAWMARREREREGANARDEESVVQSGVV
jgi:broad specificity phosphatase PhoE